MKFVLPADHETGAMAALRRDILDSPTTLGLHKAYTYRRVFEANEGAAWIVKKGLAFREHLRTVPLFIREHDKLAGSLTERPGGSPIHAEIGFPAPGYPGRRGTTDGFAECLTRIPSDLREYWTDRNMQGRHRAFVGVATGAAASAPQGYKFCSCQGHLSPSYRELLQIGLDGILRKIRERRSGESEPDVLEFLTAAEQSVLGVSEWSRRYGERLSALAGEVPDPPRARELREMARICAKIAHEPPDHFREAMQLVWLCHQAIHIEGHGYSCTPHRIDQILYPFYLRDRQAGLLTDGDALTLCENLLLKMRDNTVWGQHNLTQGVCLAGSTPRGDDQTNELSWLFVAAAENMALPEPLVWVRWHPGIDQDFFDFCLQTLAGRTCFPLFMSDTAVPFMFMELGVSPEDAFDYVPAGCNELAIPGKAYFNPGADCGYLGALERALTQGRGYAGEREADPSIPAPGELSTFDALARATADLIRRQVKASYEHGIQVLTSQMRWAQTPFTSCLFDGCIQRGRDMSERTKYNIMSCGGSAFANMVDCLAALRAVVYEQGAASLAEVAAACAANFEGHEPLRARLLAAPKHGNDHEALRDLVARVERMRDEPVKRYCRDPRDGTPYGNVHITASGHVSGGRRTGATPDGRLAGTPLASSVAAATGTEKQGPTALLNSILMMHPIKSWQCGYNANIRFQHHMLADPAEREKVRTMLNAYFGQGGQELQVNCVDCSVLRAAQANPEAYRDLVVRVAGFSQFFTLLDPAVQDEIIAREAHGSGAVQAETRISSPGPLLSRSGPIPTCGAAGRGSCACLS
ncbi:MAG: hypothetical protein JXR37_21960 [Kiritimatiellae bacterium]|nr:hypothetical protein [Kiritimatiellia bacterium]